MAHPVSKPDLLKVLVTTLIGASDGLLKNVEKGINNMNTKTHLNAKTHLDDSDIEADLEDLANSISSSPHENLETTKIISEDMTQAMAELALEVRMLELNEYVICSILTSWEWNEDEEYWFVASYITCE